MKEFRCDIDKLKELMLYVAEKSLEDPRFGATKLNKILFYSDFMAYGLHGEPITGATYQKLDRGPAPRQLLPVQEELITDGHARIDQRSYFNLVQKRLVPLRSADISGFSPEQIALVDRVIDVLKGHGGLQVSELSHAEAGWQIAEDRGDIPYESVFLSTEPLASSEIRRIQETAQQHGWT